MDSWVLSFQKNKIHSVQFSVSFIFDLFISKRRNTFGFMNILCMSCYEKLENYSELFQESRHMIWQYLSSHKHLLPFQKIFNSYFHFILVYQKALSLTKCRWLWHVVYFFFLLVKLINYISCYNYLHLFTKFFLDVKVLTYCLQTVIGNLAGIFYSKYLPEFFYSNFCFNARHFLIK